MVTNPRKKTEEVEEITGYSRTWIYTLVKGITSWAFLALRSAVVKIRASHHIEDVEQARLWQVLQENADGGLWNSLWRTGLLP